MSREPSLQTRYRNLRKSALESCRWRGHRMKLVHTLYGYTSHLGDPHYLYCITGHWECKDCSRTVTVQTTPPPNGIDIGGGAVVVYCFKQP